MKLKSSENDEKKAFLNMLSQISNVKLIANQKSAVLFHFGSGVNSADLTFEFTGSVWKTLVYKNPP